MLVLTRKIGERIRLGGNVIATVVAIKGNPVQLGVKPRPT